MLFYWIIFLLIAFIALFVKNKKHAFFIIAGLLMFLGATRGITVGNDLRGGYSAEYNAMGEDPKSWGIVMRQFEFGFQWIMAKFKFNISKDPLIFFHLLFAVTFFNYALFFYRESKYKALSLVFMMAFAYYFQLYNGMRQEFCYSIILVALSYFVLHKQKYLTFTVITIAASILFHKSMILMLVLPILYKFYEKIPTKVMIIALVISSIASVFLAKYFFNQMSLIAIYLDDGRSNFANYMTGTDEVGDYSQVSNIFNTLFCIYTVFTCRYKKSFFLTCYVAGVIVLNVLTPINWIFQRIAFPLMFYRCITYADLWYDTPNKRERVLFRVGVCLLAIIMFQNRLIADNETDVVPYVSIFSNVF